MPCFCTVPADAARNFFNPGVTPILPTAPLTLRLAAGLPALWPENRLDMQIATGFNAARLPTLDFGGGPMIQFAMMLSMMVGNFSIDDLPMLEFEMQQAANSIENNIWPRLGWLASIKMQPLINYAIIARLVIDLQDMGLDPFTMDTFPPMRMPQSFSFALTPPQIAMAKLAAGLPVLAQGFEALDLPSLGDTGAMQAFQNRMQDFSSLAMPKLIIPMPLLTKLAIVLESLATIDMAFGDGFSPSTLGRVDAMLAAWARIPLPLPLPAMVLLAKLDTLPAMEDIRLGESIAGSANAAALGMSFSPPKLAIAPFLYIVTALHASLQVGLKMDPFDWCSMCNCA